MSENKSAKKDQGWKYVLLGECPGVLMGVAGTVMAADYLHAQSEDDQPAPGTEEPEVVPVAQVSDDMSFSEAFAAARAEVGAGGVFVWRGDAYNTFHKEEWETMTEEQKDEFIENYRNTEVVTPELDTEEYVSEDEADEDIDDGDEEEFAVVEEEALSVAHVSDDMSFSEAFAAARAEVGAGGVFMWQGNAYNTFYKEEWESMTEEQKGEFMEDFRNTSFEEPQPPVTTPVVPPVDEPPFVPPVVNEPEEIDVDVVSVERVTFSDGTTGSVAEVVVNGDDGLLVDLNDDGAVDVVILDVDNDGEIDDNEVLFVDDASIPMPTDLISGCDTGSADDDLPDYMNDNDTSAFA